jgi:hypothetical protein
VTVGYLDDPTNRDETLSLADSTAFNSVHVIVRRNSIRNGPVLLQFAPILGRHLAELGAEATATFKDGVTGYKVTPESGNAELLPLALHTQSWSNMLSHAVTTGDNYTYNPETGQVTPGPDGIFELNLYPGSGDAQLPPGNFGTVDIGSESNSTQDIIRQITYGVSEEDLAYHGGELSLGENGTLMLKGDTGVSAAIRSALVAIKGKARAIPLFSSASKPGNNAEFTISGFGGIRVMDVKLTGAMKNKAVIVQPAFCVDDAAITGPGSGSSYFVYQPARLTR